MDAADMEEHTDRVLLLVDYFHEAPIPGKTVDDICVALGMALSETIGAHFEPADWAERVARISHVIMVDLLGGYDSDVQH